MEKKKKRQIVVRKVSWSPPPTDRVEVPIHLRWKLTHLAKNNNYTDNNINNNKEI